MENCLLWWLFPIRCLTESSCQDFWPELVYILQQDDALHFQWSGISSSSRMALKTFVFRYFVLGRGRKTRHTSHAFISWIYEKKSNSKWVLSKLRKTTDSGKGIQEKHVQNLIQIYKRENKRDRNMDEISARIIGDRQAYKRIPRIISCHTKRQTIPVLLYMAAVSRLRENCNLYW